MQAESGDFEGARKAAAARDSKKQVVGDNKKFVMQNADVRLYPANCQTISRIQAKAGQIAAVRDWAQKADDPLLSAHILVGAAEGLAMRVELASPKR